MFHHRRANENRGKTDNQRRPSDPSVSPILPVRDIPSPIGNIIFCLLVSDAIKFDYRCVADAASATAAAAATAARLFPASCA